jgi:predicted nucleic acid-binding protein
MTMGPRRVFVDTGAWYALQVSDDEWHEAAAAALRGLIASRHPLATTNQVVGETYTLLRMTCGHAAAVAFLDRLEESRRVERIFVGKELEARAYRLLRQYADQDFSFVDATSFAVMRSERIRYTFALDQHFATAGFTRIPVDLPIAQL